MDETKPPPDATDGKGTPVAAKVVRSAKTGRTVTARGFGALKGRSPEIKKGVNLLRPIARQAFGRRPGKRETA